MNKLVYQRKFRQALIITLRQNSAIWNQIKHLFSVPWDLIKALTAEGPIDQLIDVIFTETNLCQDNLIYLFSELEETEFFKQLIEAYVGQISMALCRLPVNGQDNAVELLVNAVNQLDLRPVLSELNLYLIENFSPSDNRSYTEGREHNIKLRRLDSFARLLSMRPEFSVCTAVTFSHGQLVIGANAPGEKVEPIVQEILSNRLDALRSITQELKANLIQRYQPNWRTKVGISVLMPAALHYAPILLEPYGCSITRDEFVQALYKWFDAMLLDDDTFSSCEKEFCLNTPPLILTPASMKGDPNFRTMCTGTFHGEQLIVYYTDQHGGLIENTPMGISKLCCETCHHALKSTDPSRPHFIVSGSHGQTFSGTVNVRTKEQAPATPKKMSPLTAAGSPLDTPEQRREKRRSYLSMTDGEEERLQPPRRPSYVLQEVARNMLFVSPTRQSEAPHAENRRSHSPS